MSSTTSTKTEQAATSTSKGAFPYGSAVLACASINAMIHIDKDQKQLKVQREYPLPAASDSMPQQVVPMPLYDRPQPLETTHAQVNGDTRLLLSSGALPVSQPQAKSKSNHS